MRKDKFIFRYFLSALLIVGLSVISLMTLPKLAKAMDRVEIAIISFSPYAPWYIVKERAMAKNIDLNVRIIEDITAKNAALTSGSVHCMQ